MKIIFPIIGSILLCISCSDDNNDLVKEVNGRFIHEITNCDNGGNPEINCTEFIEFVDGSKADFLIGGGDVVYRTQYERNENRIELKKGDGLSIDIVFNIQDQTTLIRNDNNDIWIKDK